MSKAAPYPELAERLREARSRVFSSAAAAAEALGLKAGTVRAHENGQNGVGYEDLVRYSRRYGVSLLWLITGGDDPTPPVSYDDDQPEFYELTGTVQDGAWYPVPDEPFYGPVPPGSLGGNESAPYYDERFPPETIVAFKVRTDFQQSHYIDGTILFAVFSAYVEYRPGDHVIISRERNGFVEHSVREIALINAQDPLAEDNILLKALTSESVDLEGYEVQGETEMEPLAVVIGSLSKRPMPGMTIEARRRFEAENRPKKNPKGSGNTIGVDG